jgi:hypothetical protein
MAEPQVQQAAADRGWRLVFEDVRTRTLIWVGLALSALSLFAHLKDIIEFAPWARWVVLHWIEWAHAFWQFVLGWTGLNIPRQLAAVLTFALASVSIVTGVRFSSKQDASDSAPVYAVILVAVVILVLLYINYYVLPEGWMFPNWNSPSRPETWDEVPLVKKIIAISLITIMSSLAFLGPPVLVIWDSDDRIAATSALLLFLLSFAGFLIWVARYPAIMFWRQRRQNSSVTDGTGLSVNHRRPATSWSTLYLPTDSATCC